ncbi:MAG: M1 family metallopeptidase [Sphingobacteriales bacterium]|nr:M1 family metallopeptidase [Sphingobacteriales bacterium]
MLVLFTQLSAGYCQQTYWQQQVDCKINVALNDTLHSLDGNITMKYYNNSPDTLHFIWIHLWANAFKNDHTAFTDEQLENGRTDFYFSNDEQKGYINKLAFKVDNSTAAIEDDPQHQDIIKLILPHAIVPKSSAIIETPFHVKLPYNFSGSGHILQAYQITQWYPKPAVYDTKGWHPSPYLTQGSNYGEFGNYDVAITLPKNYIVAATGSLQDTEEKNFLLKKSSATYSTDTAVVKWPGKRKTIEKKKLLHPTTTKEIKTLHFIQNNVHDFIWFADKRYSVRYDTLQLSSGKIIDVYAMFLRTPSSYVNWKNSISFIKKIILFRSKWEDEYPYTHVSAVEVPLLDGNIPSSAIMSITPVKNETELHLQIAHEAGYSWSYGSLEGNGNDDVWINEGINNFYYNQYQRKNIVQKRTTFLSNKIPDQLSTLLLQCAIKTKKDQSIEPPAYKFSKENYYLTVYIKSAIWLKLLQNNMGKDRCDSAMKIYHQRWQFQHPYPENLKSVLEEVGHKNIDTVFQLLNKMGSLEAHRIKKKVRFTRLFNLKEFESFYKIVPSLRFYLNHAARSTKESYIDIRTFFIAENSFNGTKEVKDTVTKTSAYYAVGSSLSTRYINQITFRMDNYRVLYPYDYQLQLQQGDGFYRANLTANYLFNYAKGGGLKIRLFASKFGDIGRLNPYAYQYQPKLLAGNGNDDYTYSSYFLGRTASYSNPEKPVANAGIAAQQLLIQNTGGLKFRFDQYTYLQGQSKNWVAAFNFNSSFPNIFPVKIPLSIFFDIGTYAEAWAANPPTSKFLYTGGIQLSLFKNVLNIYAPLIYSKDFVNSLKTDPNQNTFIKRISFSIDIQNMQPRKIIPRMPYQIILN